MSLTSHNILINSQGLSSSRLLEREEERPWERGWLHMDQTLTESDPKLD